MPKRSFRGFALALAAMLVVAPLTDSSARAGARAQSTSSALQATTTTAPPSAYAQLRPAPGDGKLHVVRIDPAVASIDLGLASESGAMRTAAQWSDQQDFSVVINAGS